jgi:hypothetical protein
LVQRRLTTTPHDSGTTACRAGMLWMIGSVARRRPGGDAAVMAKPASIDELRAAERRLQAAQLAADTAALDHLLDDRVLFTSGSTGACYTKHDDLHLYHTRQQILTKVSEEGLTVLVEGRTGITWFLGTVEGTVTSPVGPSRPTALHPHLDPRQPSQLAHSRRPRQPRVAI